MLREAVIEGVLEGPKRRVCCGPTKAAYSTSARPLKSSSDSAREMLKGGGEGDILNEC